METGSIKFFNTTKGFGFIKRDNGAQDIFFHINQVAKGIAPEQLVDNAPVQFTPENGAKGDFATQVSLVG
jgi:cold shock protein